MRSRSDIKRANFDFSVRDMLSNRDKSLTEEQENKLKKEREDLVNETYKSYGSYLYNKHQKEKLLERKMGYMDHFVEVAISEALSYVANNALLLDKDEYAKLNENYESEIKDLIKGFVENNEIGETFKNKAILDLYEAIQKDIPSAELYLNEDQEHKYVNDIILSTPKIKNGLDTMARDVRARVANIVSKDQEALTKETDDLDFINQKELMKAPVVPVPQEPVDQGVAPLADPEDENNIPQEPVQEPAPEETVQQESFMIKRKNNYVGIVEALALNEAKSMIQEGKEYNNTLALANAIKYITVFETLDESEVVHFGPDQYNRIVSATGKDMNPVAKTDLPGEQLVKAPVAVETEEEEMVDVPEKIELLDKTKKEEKIDKEIESLPGMDELRDPVFGNIKVTSAIDPLFKPLADWQKEHGGNTEVVDIPEQDLHGKYTNHRGDVYTESQLREYFEREGFDLDRVDFDLLYPSYNFVKH